MRLSLLAVAGVLLAGFAGLGVAVREQPPMTDAAVAEALRGQWQRPLGAVTDVVSAIFGPAMPIVALGVLLVAIVLAYRRGDTTRAALLGRCAVVGVLCRLTSLFKPVFDRERPRVYPQHAYPSGHVVSVASTAFVAVLLCLLLARHLLRRAVALALAAIVLSAAGRVVLGVHWLSDTVGAVLVVLGVGLASSVALGLLPPSPHRARVVSSTM